MVTSHVYVEYIGTLIVSENGIEACQKYN